MTIFIFRLCVYNLAIVTLHHLKRGTRSSLSIFYIWHSITTIAVSTPTPIIIIESIPTNYTLIILILWLIMLLFNKLSLETVVEDVLRVFYAEICNAV